MELLKLKLTKYKKKKNKNVKFDPRKMNSMHKPFEIVIQTERKEI